LLGFNFFKTECGVKYCRMETPETDAMREKDVRQLKGATKGCRSNSKDEYL
jgi:hypothetical protein